MAKYSPQRIRKMIMYLLISFICAMGAIWVLLNI